MSEKTQKERPVDLEALKAFLKAVDREALEATGYQPTVDKPLHHPPKGGSNVMPPPKSQKGEK